MRLLLVSLQLAFVLATGFHGLHVTGGLLAFLFVLGRTYVQMGRHAEGVATMQIIVREYPQSPLAQKAKETLVNLERR